MRLKRLDGTPLKPFDCGDEDLNDFFQADALFYSQQMLASTFILEDDEKTIAFYSLLNDKISSTTTPKNLWRKLRKSIPHEKHFNSYPAVKLGRFAVSTAFKQNGVGTRILSAIKVMLSVQNSHSACRFLTVDAYREAVPFYEKNGFKKLVNDEEDDEKIVPMYFDLKQVVLSNKQP